MLLQDPDWFEDLWLQYWANGGNADKFNFDAYVHRLCELDLFRPADPYLGTGRPSPTALMPYTSCAN